MNKIHKLFLLLLVGLTVSCSKDNGNDTEPLRDYAEQYATDLADIDEYLDTHYMTVDADFGVTITEIPTGGTQTSIRNQTEYPLQFKMVNNEDHEVEYKVYYISLREGANENPTGVDSAYVAYRGHLLTDAEFDTKTTPVWFTLDNVVKGWQEIIPLFKTGNFIDGGGSEPVTFTDFGAGVMFIPSGLGYYGNTVTGVPKYSPLVFTFKLMKQRHRDHDRDGILSMNEVLNAGDNPADYDTDADETPNYLDIDDDGDHFQTKNEIRNSNGDIVFPYLDCSGNTTGTPKYLDPACH